MWFSAADSGRADEQRKAGGGNRLGCRLSFLGRQDQFRLSAILASLLTILISFSSVQTDETGFTDEISFGRLTSDPIKVCKYVYRSESHDILTY